MAGEIFISYRRSDQDKARLLHALLKQRGVDAWYDALVGAGEDWRHRTAEALAAAPIFVLLFSKVASESDDISKELAAATFSKKLVIPVRIDDIQPAGAFLYELASRNWFDAFEDTEARFEILADKLAALVKGGPQADVAAFNLGSAQPAPVIRPAQKALLRRPAVLGGLAAAALAVAAIGLFFLLRPQAEVVPPSQRVAFFGFTAIGNDPAASEIAEAATTEVFQALSAQQVETAARADTVGPQQKSRIDRATELGARFALSGEVRPETASGRVSVAMRLEDVTARTALWEETFADDASAPLPVAVRAATRASGVGSCVVRYYSRLSRSSADKDLLATVAVYCPGAMGVFRPETQRAARKLAQLFPKDGGIQAVLAVTLLNNLAAATPSELPAWLAEAKQALAQAMALEPNSFWIALARYRLGLLERQPWAELEKILTTSLQRTPEGSWEVAGHSYVIGNGYGTFLLNVGRTRESLPYLRTATEADPLTPAKFSNYVVALALANRPAAGELLQQAFARRPTEGVGALFSAAVLLGAGDADKLLASPRKGADVEVVRCWRIIRAAIQSGSQVERAKGAAQTKECWKGGKLSSSSAIQALAGLDDLASAFDAVSAEFDAGVVTNYQALFASPTRAMRSDPRFLPLVEKLGLMEYWRATKSQPDACETEDVPFCRELKAAKP